MIRVDYNQFDKHFWSFYYLCLCLKPNWSDHSFAAHKFHSEQPPFSAGGGGLKLLPSFKKGDAWQDLSF